MIKVLIEKGQVDKLQVKCNKGFLLHHIVDQIQLSSKRRIPELTTNWKVIYRQLLSSQVEESGSLKDHLEFVRSQCLQYVHLSPLTLMDPDNQSSNIFKAKLNT